MTDRFSVLGYIAPSAALTLYQAACAADDPGAFETAAHALAVALRMAPSDPSPARPPPAGRPRLVVSNPNAQSARRASDPPGQSARAPFHLTADLSK